MTIQFENQDGKIDFSSSSFPPTTIAVIQCTANKNDYIGAFEHLEIIGNSIQINHFALFHKYLKRGLGEHVLREFAQEVKKKLPNITNIIFNLTNYNPINGFTPNQMASTREALFIKLGIKSRMTKLPSNQITVSANWPAINW